MTAEDIITDVRNTLHDEDSGDYRWTDSALLGYLTDCMYSLRRSRPEIFLNSSGLIQDVEEISELSSELIPAAEFSEGIVSYVAARALSEDDADLENRERAERYLSKFNTIAGG